MRALRRAADGTLTVSLSSLAGHYLHMHANRMLRAAHAPQEFVLYDFLKRIYDSRLAYDASHLTAPGTTDVS